MKVVIFIIFFSFFISSVNAEVVVNEIMYNPSTGQGSDFDMEWIELYNNGSYIINLSSYTIDGDNLNGTMVPEEYIVIARDKAYFNGYYNVNYTVLEVSISLTNTEDSITLTNGTYTEIVNYSSSYGADGDGYSLERINYNWPSNKTNWLPSLVINGTPGMINNRYSNVSVDYSGLRINEFLPNPEGSDSANIPGGEWIEIYNNGNEEIDLEGFYLKDEKDNDLIITRTNVYGSTIIFPGKYLVIYRNGAGGFSLNNNGYEEAKLYDPFNNLIDKVSYSHTSEGSSWMFIDGAWIKEVPNPGFQNYENKDYDKSIIKISNIYDLGKDKKAKWGQTIRIRLDVYKGDSSKNHIKAWAGQSGKKISKVSSFNIYSRFTNEDLTIPIQLFANCKGKYEDGYYYIYVEGLDTDNQLKFYVDDITTSLCQKVVTTNERGTDKIVFDSISPPSEITNDAITKIVLFNNDKGKKDVEIWSYIYRGNKAYSGDRKGNMQELKVPGKGYVEINLKNSLIENTEPGDYKLKVKMKQEGRKTEDEFTASVKITSLASSNDEFNEFSQDVNEKEENLITGDVIYESSDVKARKFGIYFFSGTLILVIFYLLFKKTL